MTLDEHIEVGRIAVDAQFPKPDERREPGDPISIGGAIGVVHLLRGQMTAYRI
ncbi:MAG TPA: hypothetical protein VNE82_14415 [Candidatus Binataceae bacterium]|nr:hypothetical protein [Candidatus Binataceae bacterium]